MCGVFGYIGERNAIEVCLNGLEQLEYRGYDSTGIAGIHNRQIASCKKAGKLSELKLVLPTFPPLSLAIAHTRWATHGKVNDLNAHPHFDPSGSIALIHNGIIENYDELRESLKTEGASFQSETDSEIVAHLIAKHYRGDLSAALHSVIPKLRGIYALVAIHKDHPDEIAAAARDCPLAIAVDQKKSETILSSDPNTLVGAAYKVLFLRDREIARVKKGSVEVFGDGWKKVKKKIALIEGALTGPSKEGFEHYMLKEIYEQPLTAQKAILGRFENGVSFDELRLPVKLFNQVKKVWFIGCGTSSHAGQIGSILLEDIASMPAITSIASEARYCRTLMTEDTLVVAISQSGETADTLRASRRAQARLPHARHLQRDELDTL